MESVSKYSGLYKRLMKELHSPTVLAQLAAQDQLIKPAVEKVPGDSLVGFLPFCLGTA